MSDIFLKEILNRTVNSDRIKIYAQDKTVLYDGYAANVYHSGITIDDYVVDGLSVVTEVMKRQKYHWGMPVLEHRELDKPINCYDFGELSVGTALRIDVRR
jgi:hypothetical protein